MASIDKQQNVTVVSLDAEYDSLDEATIEAFAQELLGTAGSIDPPRMVLDFSNTTFLGSRFIEIVVRAWKRLCERKGEMALCNLDPFCAEVLDRTHLNKLWRFFPSREEAVAALAS
jgi:anti-anti-sigma factor